MFKKCVSIIALVSVVFFSLYSCADEKAVQPANSRGAADDSPDWLENELRRAPELQELIAIRDELAMRAIARGVTPEQIRDAANDVNMSNALLGFTPDEASVRFNRINALIGSAFGRYPALADIAAREATRCPVCDADGVALAWEHYSKVLPAALGATRALALGAPARPPLTCKMTQLVIGFGLCAAKSGGSMAFYFVCSYGVFCSACDGGVADVICP